MSYFKFLCVFLAPPIFVLGVYFFKFEKKRKAEFLQAIALLCLLAFAYTTPWDNYLVANGIWSYGEDRVLGVIGYVPYEEYAFFFLQTIMTGHWAHFVSRRTGFKTASIGNKGRLPAVMAFIALETMALSFLWFESTQYLGLITSWSLPVIFIQFFFGQEALAANKRYLLAAIAPPTLYLWAADLFAIKDGIWNISGDTTIGLNLFGLPVEEALFFLVTNIMVVQGICLFVFAKKESLDFMKRLLPKKGSRA